VRRVDKTDVAIVGGGIIGLATARALLQARPGLGVAVLEKEQEVATHQTAHSSFVLHSGVYYAPGSLKARLCVEGALRMRAFCAEHGIDVLECGKVIVAVDEPDLPRLDELHRRGVANGVSGLEPIGPRALHEFEPHVRGLRALRVPGTAVVDFRRVAGALAAEVVRLGGIVRTRWEVTGLERRNGSVVLQGADDETVARNAIACAGVRADRVARLGGGTREPRIVPFRGDYYVLRPERRHLLNGLVYPVPDPRFPFLGVHSTLRPDGAMWLGPNALLAGGRDSYGRFGIVPRDLLESLSAPGFRRLAARHWRLGAIEAARGYSRRFFVQTARRLVPELRAEDVVRGPSGIRAQALGPDGSFVDDFVFEESAGVLHVRNAPSPGATSSLAIADEIVGRAVATFGL
jgi:(S)-2-hydroxyglutarate dehydrogenase